MKLKKLSLTLFEISLVFLLLQHTVFPSQMTTESLALNILCGIFMVYAYKGVFLNPYLKSSVVFLVLGLVGTMVGHGEIGSARRTILFAAMLMSSFFIYNYLFRISNIERFMKLYVAVQVVAMVMVLLLVGDRALTSRLGHNGSGSIVSYWIAGVPIYKSSNTTANICAICVLFLMYFVEFKKKRWCYVPVTFFIICLFLCGSRKGLLTLIIFVSYAFFFMNKGVTLKKLALLVVLPVAIYFVFTKIPLVYNLIGRRVESLVLNYLGYSNRMDGSSFVMREYLKKEAWDWILEKPLLGYGFQTFNKSIGYGAENNMLQILLEYGLVGLVTYYAFLPSMLFKMVTRGRRNVFTELFTVLILALMILDYGGVTYFWQYITMWYSIFWAVIARMGK